MTMGKFCRYCGKRLSFENAEICPNCGCRIKAPPGTRPDQKPGKKTGTYLIIGIFAFFILVAVVFFLYVTSGAGHPSINTTRGSAVVTSQTGQETAYSGVSSATSPLELVGNVYGMASKPSEGIDSIRFAIALAPGSPPLDLSKMTMVLSTPSDLKTYYWGNTASTVTFTTTGEDGSSITVLNANERAVIQFNVPALKPNTEMTLEIKPATGASLPVRRTMPASISIVNVLY
jgi:archaeal flagellin FlaB